MIREITHPIETFRTAPVQIACAALEASVLTTYSVVAELSEASSSQPNPEAVVIGAGVIVLNAVIAKGRIKIRNRVESILERRGFDERAMNTTTRTWCSRQAARVACENYGYLEDYKTLCDQSSAGSQLSWLPHISQPTNTPLQLNL